MRQIYFRMIIIHQNIVKLAVGAFYNAVTPLLPKYKPNYSLYHKSEQRPMLSRQQLEAEISRLMTDQPNIFSSEVAEIINQRYGTNYSPNNIATISTELEKLSQQTLRAIFSQFQRYETDFTTISQRTGVPLPRVRKEILKVMVTNIVKVCIIVRKRSISKLVKNFLSHKNIQCLAALIMKPCNFRTVKLEYSLLWNFITRLHQQGFFKTVSDQSYKLIYRELIILAEAYKVSEDFEDGGAVGFERITLQQNGMNDPFSLLKDFKKKNYQETIDLISDDQEQQQAEQVQDKRGEEIEPQRTEKRRNVDEQSSGLMAILEKPVERGQLQGQRFLVQLVALYSRMSELQRQSKEGTQGLIDEMTQTALKICTIEYLIGLK